MMRALWTALLVLTALPALAHISALECEVLCTDAQDILGCIEDCGAAQLYESCLDGVTVCFQACATQGGTDTASPAACYQQCSTLVDACYEIQGE